MSLTWTDPVALWLLLFVPLVWLAHLVARTNFNGRQRWLQAAVRSLLLAAIACALARPIVATSSSRTSIVYLVDISHSIASRAIEDAAARIDELNGALRPAHFRIVAFGASAAVLDDSKALRQLADIGPQKHAGDPVDRSRTDLESALAVARAELAPGYVPRLILFSDGEANGGDTSAAVARLAADRIPLSVEPLGVRSIGDTWIDTLDVPGRIAAGETFVARIGVGSQREATALLEVRAGSQVLASRKVDVPPGLTSVPIEVVVSAPGAQVLQGVVAAEGDPLPMNNTLDRGVWAEPQARVLYVEGTPASAHYLDDALTAAGMEVAVQPPSALPTSSDDLEAWDVMVLSDVARTAISEPAMAALAEWVEKKGGGLLVAGGEAVFGEGGYRQTPIEHVTPVTFERRDEPQVALVIVLDRSWSMSGQSMELCKAAAQAAVDTMTDEQFLGVLTFNDQFNWDVPVRNVGKNRREIREKIGAIEAAGHTLIFPAVEQAYLALRTAKARAKHVILLSDGRSYPDDYEGLVKKMVAAHVTVSSVAVGPAADDELLANIAKWGKGRSYVVQDPKDVPRIFVKEAKNAMTPGFDEKGITPVVKSPAFLTGVDLEHLPSLKGRTATVIKDTALQVITSDNDDPLLAFWPAGLGRTAVFASDVKDRWAADWITWRGYGPFFSSVVRALQRQRPEVLELEVASGVAQGQARTVGITVEARTREGAYRNLLRPQVRVQIGDRSPATVSLRQVAPGRYEGTVIADANKTISVSATDVLAGGTSRIVVPDPAAEYRFRPIDDVLLKSMVSATGGAWKPTPQTLASHADDRRTERRPLWPVLLAIALGLWFVDLLFRRIRVFEAPIQNSEF